MQNILLIGCGNMGSAMVGGWLKMADCPPITIIEPNPIDATFAGRVTHYHQLGQIPAGQQFAIIIIAIKPQMCQEVLPATARYLAHEGAVLSIVAGKTSGYFQQIYGGHARIFRVMPNTPALVGLGLCALYGPTEFSGQYDFMVQLLQPLGMVLPINSEDKMDAITALSGSGPAYIFAMAGAMIDAGIKIGLTPEESLIATKQTIWGAGHLLAHSPLSPAQLRQNVTSPNGTTQSALSALCDNQHGINPLMEESIKRAYLRSQELGKS